MLLILCALFALPNQPNKNQEKLPEVELAVTMHGHRYGIEALCVVPGSKVLVTASGHYVGTESKDGPWQSELIFWDLLSEKEMKVARDTGGIVTAVKPSRDGNYLVSGAAYGVVNIWDVSKMRIARRFDGIHEDAVYAVAFDSKRKIAYSGGLDARAMCLPMSQEAKPIAWQAHAHPIILMEISTDDNTLVTIARPFERDKTGCEVVAWDCAKGEQLRKAQLSNVITAIAFFQDSRYLVADERGKISLLDVATMRLEPLIDIPEGQRITS